MPWQSGTLLPNSGLASNLFFFSFVLSVSWNSSKSCFNVKFFASFPSSGTSSASHHSHFPHLCWLVCLPSVPLLHVCSLTQQCQQLPLSSFFYNSTYIPALSLSSSLFLMCVYLFIFGCTRSYLRHVNSSLQHVGSDFPTKGSGRAESQALGYQGSRHFFYPLLYVYLCWLVLFTHYRVHHWEARRHPMGHSVVCA